jgi:hypothetical protein
VLLARGQVLLAEGDEETPPRAAEGVTALETALTISTQVPPRGDFPIFHAHGQACRTAGHVSEV